jgi:hypothetical protein
MSASGLLQLQAQAADARYPEAVFQETGEK